MEMLHAADQFNQRRRRRRQPLKITTASLHYPQAIKTPGGLMLQADQALDAINAADIVILPAIWRNPQKLIHSEAAILPWLQAIAAQSTLICAVGTASCFLAEAGLLNNKPATTHWFYFDEFAKRYPRVRLQRQHLITQAGNLFCAGSVNSLADLMIHFIQRFYGQDIAQQTESHFSPEIRQSYESHFYSDSIFTVQPDEDVARIQQWLQSHYRQSINMHELAEEMDLSTRTFNRRFKKATGFSPSDFLQNIRLQHARDLLKESNLGVSEIADQVGYNDGSYFTKLFRKQLGITPLAYRKQVRGKLFSAQQEINY